MHTEEAASPALASRDKFPPLESVTKPTVTTEEAAYYTNRRPQTLRNWSCNENGPLRPRKVNGMLAWSVPEIRELMGVTA